jgi:hypothetical protein
MLKVVRQGLVNDPSIRYKMGRRGVRVLAYYAKATSGARVVVTCRRALDGRRSEGRARWTLGGATTRQVQR